MDPLKGCVRGRTLRSGLAILLFIETRGATGLDRREGDCAESHDEITLARYPCMAIVKVEATH